MPIRSNSQEKEDIKNFIKTNEEKVRINLIEYDYYNFAKINNDVTKNYISNEYEFILFSNNDIVLLNDVISGMIKQYKNDLRAGTIGARLHYDDNLLQHDGVNLVINPKTKAFMAIHHNSKNYYNFNIGTIRIFGCTGALLMIRKQTFEKVGMFNEIYEECFEDVELNLQTIKLGLNNYLCGDCVAHHLESPTRMEIPNQRDRIERDANKLLKLYKENFNILKPYTAIAYE